MNPWIMGYGFLTSAIVCEVVGTSLLVKTNHFTRLVPTLGVLVLYAVSIYFLAQSLKVLPIGIAYAIWGGMGIVLIALIGVLVLGQSLDLPAMIGIALILAGVITINVFSKTVGH